VATRTPTELAVELWGSAEGYSRSAGARRVRRIARDLFPDDAPGQGREWHLTDAQAAQICEHLAGDEPSEFYDYDAAVVAMLTLRINTPVGEWLNDADHKRFWAYYDEAVAAEGEEDALERMLLTFVNTAQSAIGHLAGLTGRTSQEWLQQIAVEMRPPPGST
jgi:hypothetical protein